MKIKEKLLELKDIGKKVFEKYPLSMIVIFLYTIFFATIVDSSIKEDTIEKIIMFGGFFGLSTFFAENIFETEKVKKIISYIVGGAIAIAFTVYFSEFCKDYDFICKLAICYCSTLGLSSLYLLIKKSEKDIPEYLLKVCVNYFKISVVYGILSIGILALFEIFTLLIYDFDESLLARIEILLFGFYYVTNMLYAFIDMKDEVGGFFKVVIKYVFMTLLTIAFAIVYLYIVKIIILRNMPKNQICRILIGLFTLGLPVWTCEQYFKDDSLSYKISLKLPFAFIPFVFLQLYTIGVRIASYGITPNRYFVVAFIIFEIIYLLFYIIKKEKISLLAFVADILIIVMILIPGINIIELSDSSQIKIMEKYRNEQSLSKEEKDKVYGAYVYLKYTEGGEEYLKGYSKKEIDKIEDYYENSYSSRTGNKYHYCTYQYRNYIDVGDYKQFVPVYNMNSYGSDCELDKVNFTTSDLDDLRVIELDMKSVITKYIDIDSEKGDMESNKYFSKNNEFIISPNEKIIITDLSINYNETEDEIPYIQVKGYYLKK